MAATSRMAVGSLFGAVSTTAETLTNTLTAVNDGIGMLNTTIRAAAERQKKREAIDMVDWERQYLLTAVQQAREFDHGIEKWIASHGENEHRKFNETLAQFQNAIAAREKKGEA